MYTVYLRNNDTTTVINSPTGFDRITGTIEQGINCIDNFIFNIYPNNSGYELIEPYKTIVEVYNMKTEEFEFIGRVLKYNTTMDNDGLISKEVTCESELAYLVDTVQMYKEIKNSTVKGFLKTLIDNHNANVGADKQFKLGVVDVIDPNDSIYRYISYDTTWKNIAEDLIDSLGGEISLRYYKGDKYIDYLTNPGIISDTEIRLGRNIQEFTREIDTVDYITRLIPLGAKLKVKNSEGNEEEIEERLTIAAANGGKNYIDDAEGIAKFGIIEGFVYWDDVTEVRNLLTKGRQFIASQRVNIVNDLSALDLSLIGLDIDSFKVGNHYRLSYDKFGTGELVRVVRKIINIENPHENSITLGDLYRDLKRFNVDSKKDTKNALKTIKTTVTQVGNINARVTNVNNEIKNINDLLNNSNVDVAALREQVTQNTARIALLETKLDEIKVNTDKIPNLELKLDEILGIIRP